MAEENRCQAPPEGHRLCANNCGFFGSPATLNLCSKCYRDLRLKEEQESSAKMAVEKSLFPSSPSSSCIPALPLLHKEENVTETTQMAGAEVLEAQETGAVAGASPAASPPQTSRCRSCRKRVGLTGFRCRCGETFCGTHRYPEKHKCSFDFKSMGKEELARANPVVKAPKLDKI